MDEKFPESTFQLIYRRAPLEHDRIRLLGVKSALGLSDNDEMWPLLLTLDQYSASFNQGRHDILVAVDGMQAKITAAVGKVDQSLEAKANLVMAGVVDKGVERLLRTVQQTADTADRISKKQFMTAAGLGAVVALLCLVVGGAVGYIISNQVTANRSDICTSASFITSDKRLGCYLD